MNAYLDYDYVDNGKGYLFMIFYGLFCCSLGID